ncbi:hypothetical protein OAH80_04585 [Acidimicrobiia bacterium]|nr:hypothetical protein [Acidimicrobiia bacterium]|tara:strand:- start:5290 stop:6165 length:876 start_codon:yes stop_codon:yes gene_type:complete
MNSYPLNGIDSKLISKILNDEVYFESEINYLARLEDFHGKKNSLTYVNNKEYAVKAIELGYSFILIKPEDIFSSEKATFITTKNPRQSFIKIVNYLNENKHYTNIDKLIGKNVTYGKNVEISDNVQIGNNVQIGHNVVILDNVLIEDNVTIGNFCVLGSKGNDVDLLDNKLKFTGVHGGLQIGENSIIRNFVMIDSSIWGHNTIINRNVSIDSNVLVGHDVFISENVKIRGGATIAGFSKIGKNTIIGLETVITQRSVIGEDCLTTAGSIISKNYPNNSKIISFPPKVQKF